MSKTDSKAPKSIKLTLQNGETESTMFSDFAMNKEFSTGSKGYFCSGKMSNPESGEKYQITCSITLIGSKPKK